MSLRYLGLIAFALFAVSAPLRGQTPATTDQEAVAAINVLYGNWIKALAERGAEGYASFFVEDGAVLPPNSPAVEGRDAIRQWIQKDLEEFSVKDARFVPGKLRVSNGWAVQRFSISGKRAPKKGGDATPFNNKYMDILQKQPDGSWKFVHRMWNSNE